MTFQVSDFTAQVRLNALIHYAYPNRLAELNAITAALVVDGSTRDTTLTTAPAGLRPGAAGNSSFTNDILLVVNAGKGGNLTPAQMATAINTGLSQIIPPSNTGLPVVTGTGAVGQLLINASPGTWTPAGAVYTRQWLRNGVNIGGATANNYTTVVADAGTSVSCQVTATNPAGATSAVSNAIAVAPE
jgi:hypothetical protein